MNTSVTANRGSLHPRFFQRFSESSLSVPSPRAPDRIVACVPLSDAVPAQLIARSLAQALRAETGEAVILISLSRAASRTTLDSWADQRRTLNGEFALGGGLETSDGGLPVLAVQTSGPTDPEHSLGSLIDHCSRHFGYVVVQAGSDTILPTILDALRLARRAYLLGLPRDEDSYHRELLIRESTQSGIANSCQIKTVICCEKGNELITPFLRQAGPKVDACLHGSPGIGAANSITHWTDRDFNADIRRLTREVTRRRLGLALSSGGARGLSHIGVIQVLEENGIEIDAMVGCSMGSYVGAVWAYGFDGVAMERLAREVEHRWGLFELIDPFILPRQGFLRGEKVKLRLKRSIGEVHFEELLRPLRIVATHLATLGRTVFSSGEVAQAVHASSAIPGACVPVNLDGELYIDGGIADPLPVDVLEEMGIERIIAVNTIPTPEYLRARLEIEKERDARLGRRASKFKTFINRYLNYFAPGNVLDTILRSFNGAQMQVAEHSGMFADLVLRPLSFDGRWHDFRRPGKYIAIGRREAELHLDEIKSLVNRKEPSHERAFAHQ